MSNHVSTLRRDFLLYFINHVLKQPYALNIDTSNPNEFKLTLIPSPPNIEDLRSRLDNISHILDFLSCHLIPYLPESEGNQFARSLSRPIASSVLNNLLMPSLPSSFGLLPSFLSLLERAVLLEEEDISKLLGKPGNEGIIKAWSDVVSGHYERRRRIEILELARKDIVEAGDPKDTFKVIIDDGGLETSRSVISFQDEDFKDDAWGFDEPATSNPVTESTDGWGFDDDKLEPEVNGDGDVDPADAWGWNEEEDVSVESPSLQPPPEDIPRAGHVNGAHLPMIPPKEYYQVPTRTKRFMRMVETVIDESKLFYASNLFPASEDMVPAPGSILLQSASSILDLYQALYPVKFAKELELPERAMLFSNSCLYMANAVQQIEDTIYGQPILKDRLSECRHHLQLLGESWFNETIVRI